MFSLALLRDSLQPTFRGPSSTPVGCQSAKHRRHHSGQSPPPAQIRSGQRWVEPSTSLTIHDLAVTVVVVLSLATTAAGRGWQGFVGSRERWTVGHETWRGRRAVALVWIMRTATHFPKCVPNEKSVNPTYGDLNANYLLIASSSVRVSVGSRPGRTAQEHARTSRAT